MNRNQLFALIVLGVVVGGAGLLLYNRNAASWKASDLAMGQTIIKEFPLNDITQIGIQQSGTEVTLVKTNDQWSVRERWDYPANFSEVGDLLRKVWELKSGQTLRAGPSQYDRLQLLSPAKEKSTNVATLLEFKDKTGKLVSSLLLGKKASRESEEASPFGGGGYPVGRYVAIPADQQHVWLVSETFSDAEAKPDRWLNKDFFKVEKLRSISVTHTNATNSWKLTREKEGGDLELADKKPDEEFDKNKAYSAGNALSYPSFNDVASPTAKPEELGMDKAIVASLETFDNFRYTIKAAPTTNENYNLQLSLAADLVKERVAGKDEKPEDKTKLDKEFQDKLKKLEDKLKQEKGYEKWTYVVSKWTIDPLLKERKDFMAEKKPAETPGGTNTTKTATPPSTKPAADNLGLPQLPALPDPDEKDE